MTRIAIVHPNDGTDVRIGKLCRSLSRMKHEVIFIGWDRRPKNLKEIALGGAERHVLTLETQHGKGSIVGSFRYILFVYKQLFRFRPEVAYCVNEDNAIFVLPFRGLLFRRSVCDVFDALADRHSGRSVFVRQLTRLISYGTRALADRMIATDQTRFERFGRYRQKTRVIENYPEDPGEGLSLKAVEGELRVYVCGTLTENRGLRQILAAVERDDRIRLVAAGWAYDEFAESTFIEHPKVTWHGIVTAQRSLELAASCDAIFCYYAPVSINNQFASPNKVYDALSVGRPILINQETRISDWVLEKEYGYVCPYSDVDALSKILASLHSHRWAQDAFARRAREAFVSNYNWGLMEKRLEVLIAELSPTTNA